MKKMLALYCLVFAFVIAGCDEANPLLNHTEDEGSDIEDLSFAPGFDYATTKDVRIELQVNNIAKRPLSGVPLNISMRIEGEELTRVSSGLTDNRGMYNSLVSIPSFIEEVIVTTSYPGIPDTLVLPVQGTSISFTYGDRKSTTGKSNGGLQGAFISSVLPSYTLMGGWDVSGVPDYLEPEPDDIDERLLSVVSASLPEGDPVPSAHPEYLAGGNDMDVLLLERADIWVTFVHEGAGWRNALGYYTYNIANPPTTVDEIETHTLIFPNVSFAGSGGGLYSGDKVHLGTFDGGTGIGWFLVGNGWNGSGVGNGAHVLYSDPSFNPESDPNLQQHSVLLKDDISSILLMGFEDLRRDSNSDNDFNDAVFYVTANPISAVQTTNVLEVTDPGSDPSQDADGDGVLNGNDEYPYNENKVSNIYQPAEGVYGTLAFEDLWPSKGDYDFNDLVLDYNFRLPLNANNQVVGVDGTLVVKAIGAGFKNGFGFELPISSELISSVVGNEVDHSAFSLAGSGTENGQDNAVIIAFDNAYEVVDRPSGFFVNTQRNAPYVAPDTISVSVTFTQPLDQEVLGTAPFNPFLVSNYRRGHEVHLPGYSPTNKADRSLFGTAHDRTVEESGYTYKADNELPWALHFPVSFYVPIEKADITQAYSEFENWASSGGVVSTDWYILTPGNHDAALIYFP